MQARIGARWSLRGALTLAGLIVLPALGVAAAPPAPVKHTQTSTIHALSTVLPQCRLSAESLSFSTYDPTDTNVKSADFKRTDFAVWCSLGTHAAIHLDGGQHALGAARFGNRAMQIDGGKALLGYDICHDADCSQPWTSSSSGDYNYFAATGREADVPVYGRIAAGQDVPAGTYGDVVTATVNF